MYIETASDSLEVSTAAMWLGDIYILLDTNVMTLPMVSNVLIVNDLSKVCA